MPHRNHPLPTRLYLGIADHFPVRRSEWTLACIMIGWGAILIAPRMTFAGSPAWSQMAAMMDEQTWGWLAIIIGSFRLIALVLNGTFSKSWYGRWSPHVRALASFLACFLWLQISFGLWASGEVPPGLAAYVGLLAQDVMNIIAATKDAANMDRAVADGSP